ncbi:hypothetical protein BWI95_02580 [Kosakonia cowanii JCM 10956 = DSM 18146]|uniref:Uncharacterized protein n=1 Tax=Kosakonia cowanii JCM 10956 = DSM 18146 TaxID=1300165 RepID=A0A807LCS7_9ENTR|nr:hypothetical protein [Kosakonia cowanii]APZ04031.1 hypothetical protein BWI95_02580 [Kosakonia cowanii JCM 10956 = DSM 18146]
MLAITLAALACGIVFQRGQRALNQTEEIVQQVGFYDLMLHQQEIYDSRMSTAGNIIISTLSSPHNAAFMLKSNFVHTRQRYGKHYFAYPPVLFNPAKDNRMVTNNVDLLTYSENAMQQIAPDGVPLVCQQNGMIFRYQLEPD